MRKIYLMGLMALAMLFFNIACPGTNVSSDDSKLSPSEEENKSLLAKDVSECPTDGTFKYIDAFGRGGAPIPQAVQVKSPVLNTEAFYKGEIKFHTVDSNLLITALGKEPLTCDMGGGIFDIVTGKNFAEPLIALATEKGLKAAYANDIEQFGCDKFNSFKLLGTISAVAAGSSGGVDNVPSGGPNISINAVPPGQKLPGKRTDYIYFATGSNWIGRMTPNVITNGGCIEYVYDASGIEMSALRIDGNILEISIMGTDHMVRIDLTSGSVIE